jgi:serine/threonine-protein kinase
VQSILHSGFPVSTDLDGRWGSSSRPVPERPTVLQGTYRIVEQMASGGMGEVYLAVHERFPGRFALKILHRDLLGNEEARARFSAEVEILASLRHPNIVQVIDSNVAPDGTPYLVMELVEGEDLGAHVGQPSQLSPVRIAHVIRQIASALQLAHDRGVVHRDLKLENVMLLSVAGQEDFVKVIDFGISTSERSPRMTAESAILGTPQFMAPEQAQGRGDEIDHRTDQFALACIAYTLLAGRVPFHADTAIAVLYQVVHQDPEPLARWVPWHCEDVDSVLRRAMAKDREARFPSIMEFARELEAAIGRAPKDEESVPEQSPRRRQFSSAAMVAAGVVGAAVAVATLMAMFSF